MRPPRLPLQRTTLLAVCLLAITGVSSAKDNTAKDPARYAVKDVAATDTLKLRSLPSPTAVIVSTIPPTASLIIGTGTTRETNDTAWREVTYLGITGWVNARYLKKVPDTALTQTLPETLVCTGTEPHWSLTSDEHSRLNLSASFLDKPVTLISAQAQASVNQDTRWFINAVTTDGKQPVALTLQRNSNCSDDMSDTVYKYDITIKFTGGVFASGGCNKLNTH